MRYLIAIFVWGMMMSVVRADGRTTYTVDIGGPMDGLFIRDHWQAVEGPYPQWADFWSSTGRWASQGARVRVPVFPGVVNTFEVRAQLDSHPDQRLYCSVNGQRVAECKHTVSYIYKFDVRPDVIGQSGWAELVFETAQVAPTGGDARDLRVAIDWIKISADAPGRAFIDEAVKATLGDYPPMACDAPPTRWRMRYDPNNIGDTFGIQNFSQPQFDDSAFAEVRTSYVPGGLRRGEVVWYRAKLLISKKLNAVRRDFELPGEGFEKDGHRTVYVNGAKVEVKPGESARAKIAEYLAVGVNHVAVKIMRGPLPGPTGDDIVERPGYTGQWSTRKVIFNPGTLVLKPGTADVERLTVKLISPSGQTVGTASGAVANLGDGRRGFDPKAAWKLSDYGEHGLVVTDGKGRSQKFPVHYLGIHFFHWGWYTAGGGTVWNGFSPCSNDFIDQLFNRLGDWNQPHHSISWGGCIIEPGTGFHKTQNVNYIAKQREAMASGLLDFVGAPFPPRNVCTDFGESLIRGMRRSLALYKSQFGVTPHTFVSHDATMNPLLPQIMRMCGYDTYVLPENWWGQENSIPGSRDCLWANPDGTTVRCLDSWYHGLPPLLQARRAVELGKPAVLCNEEFACLDQTVFLSQTDREAMAAEGIFVQPVNLDEYQRITERFARSVTYQGDDALCYKGWTGGAEGEVEFEKANRILETKLVALENLVAFARYLGIEVDPKPIDDWWNSSLRYHECHLHWGNGIPDAAAGMLGGAAWAVSEMERLAGLIVSRITCGKNGVAAFNPLGFSRGGLVRFEAPDSTSALAVGTRAYPVQPDPDDPAKCVAWLPELPSCGYRAYAFSEKRPASHVAASVRGDRAYLSNGKIRVTLTADGRIATVTDALTGKRLLSGANALYLAKPHDMCPDEPLSCESNPLNLGYYECAVAADRPKLICGGPVTARVECKLRVPNQPNAEITAQFSLEGDERQVRVKLMMSFKDKTVVWPKGAPQPNEGTYFPGIFVRFPLGDGTKPRADMAYCTTDNALASTNHETFMKQPFRHGTFNCLSFAGPSTGEYAVLTRGLPDFFVTRRPQPYLGLSLGMGTDQFPYHDTYNHEYAVFVPAASQRAEADVPAYKAAQAFYVDPLAVACNPGRGNLALENSFIAAGGKSVIIPGVQMENGQLTARILNLSHATVKTTLRCLASLSGAGVVPSGKLSNGRLTLGPQALREINLKRK